MQNSRIDQTQGRAPNRYGVNPTPNQNPPEPRAFFQINNLQTKPLEFGVAGILGLVIGALTKNENVAIGGAVLLAIALGLVIYIREVLGVPRYMQQLRNRQ